MSKPGAIIIGWINKGKKADCGETMKNQLMVSRLEALGVHCRQMDFKNWKRHPWVILQLGWNMLVHRHDTIIFSTSAENVYPMMRLMKSLRWRQNTVHWVIGGTLGYKCASRIYNPDVIGYIGHTLVESPAMVDDLTACGVKNVMQLPNFKPITYLPDITHRNGNRGSVRFVFLSRIMPEKGCDYILQATETLNAQGLQDKFTVDFYGAVKEDYADSFHSAIRHLPNVSYRGFLDLSTDSGYDTLAGYDAMLFPTHWKGEGFAGIFIDSFIAGLPIIASEWAHNRYFLHEGDTALFIPPHDSDALANKMHHCINNPHELTCMSKCCQEQAQKYDVNNVITPALLSHIGIFSHTTHPHLQQ